MTGTGKGNPLSGRGRRPGGSRGAFFFALLATAFAAALASAHAAVAPLAPPPSLTVTPLDEAVRLSWPRQADSLLVAVGIPDGGLADWGGASTPIVSGLYTGSCDQDYAMQLRRFTLAQGKLVLSWEETPPESTSLAGQVEIVEADSLYGMTAGIRLGLTRGNTLAVSATDTVMVTRGAGLVDTLRFAGSWTGGAAPRDCGLWVRQGERGVFVFTAASGGTVFAESTSPAGLTLNWDFYLSAADTVVRTGTLVIPKADTLVAAELDSTGILVPMLRVALGAGSVNAGETFAVEVTPSAIATEGSDAFMVTGASFEGYAIWRSEVIDLEHPIYVGKIRRCGAPAESVAFFDRPVLEYFDHEAHNGYPYYYAVTVSDAVIDSISQADWESLRIKTYPRRVAYDSTFATGASPFTDAHQAHAVPNPYKLSEEWEEGEAKIQFVDLPPEATVYIYTESGDYVTSIRQTDPRSDRVDWNLRNGHGRKVMSGIYIFKVESPHGEKTGRFVVIR
jgi:hypothetical protein